jgi:glucose-6-phosphate 1-epimerase
MATLPEGARIESGRGGLQRLHLEGPEGVAEIYLHGANVTHFQPRGERPVLWLSAHGAFEAGAPGKPIRGGVPICFPWFGPRPDAPIHGVARLLAWKLAAVDPAGDALRAVLELCSDDYTHGYFPGVFRLQYVVTAGRELQLELRVRNAGDQPFRFDEALHTYFAVGDVRRVMVGGLSGAAYVDKVDGGARRVQGREPLAFSGETDRVFVGHEGPLTLTDSAWERKILVRRGGSRTAVVWNPWIAKAKAMPDFGDDEWTGMVCVESANALEDAVMLEPGAEHVLTTRIGVEGLTGTAC